MIFAQSAKFKLRNLLMVILLLWITEVCLSQAQEANKQDTTMGELKLEGKYIERLVLGRRNGHTQRLDHPAETIKLPVGEYNLMEIHLIDGFSCRLLTNDRKVTITNDKPVILKLGAPLTQTVKVKRQGSVLLLNYELLGSGGETYTSSDRSKPPTFTIYKGDKEITSGKFEFGWGGTCSYSWRVPPKTFGKFRIVASKDIGILGTKQSAEVICKWRWYYSAPGVLLWLALILVFVLPKSNRNPRALLIIAPLVVVNLLYLLLKTISGMPSSVAQQYDMLFQSISIGIAVMCLVGNKLGNSNHFFTFLRALVLMAVICLVGEISYFGLNFSQQTFSTLIMSIMSVFVILLGFVLAGRRCRIRYSSLRFMLYLAFWTIVVCLVSMLVVFLAVSIIQKMTISISSVLIMIPTVGLIFGACLYVIVFPFMILAIYSPFFRERFYACLRLESMPATASQPNTNQSHEQ